MAIIFETPSASSPLMQYTQSYTQSSSSAAVAPAASGACFILPEQLDYSPASYFEPEEGECITTDSPCRCGTWYFPTLPPSLGGCGHIYRVQPNVCHLHPYPQPCPGVEWTRKVRSQFHILGLCPACKVVPSKVAAYKKQVDVLTNPASMEQCLKLLLATQDYFAEEKKKRLEMELQYSRMMF